MRLAVEDVTFVWNKHVTNEIGLVDRLISRNKSYLYIAHVLGNGRQVFSVIYHVEHLGLLRNGY